MKKVLSFLTLGLTCNLPKLSSRIEEAAQPMATPLPFLNHI